MSSTYVFEFHRSTSGILPPLVEMYDVKVGIYFMEAEKALLTGLRDLDPQTITKIHETYFPLVYRYAYYRVGDEAVCEDLASDTFIRLLESIHAGRGPKSSIRGWLMGTVSNLVNDHYRQVYNKPKEPLQDTIQAQNSDPVTLSEKRTRQQILRLGLSKLTPDQQHVLALRFGNNCSLAETAEIMGKKQNAIKQLQFRALAALRKYIEAEI